LKARASATFFEQFFGGRAGQPRGASPFDSQEFCQRPRGGRESTARGHDIQGDILITLDEVLKGAMRAISVRRTNASTGREETETYQVRVPKGVHAGQSIRRIRAKAARGSNGGSAGDIYLRVRYAQHPDWQVRGFDLMGHLELAPWEAVLGATVPSADARRARFHQEFQQVFNKDKSCASVARGLPAGAEPNTGIFTSRHPSKFHR
jgi:curved DNA-binding protein